MKSHIIYPITIQVGARNDIAVDRGGCDRPNRNRRIDRTNWCTFLVKNGKVDRQGDNFIVLLVELQKLTRADKNTWQIWHDTRSAKVIGSLGKGVTLTLKHWLMPLQLTRDLIMLQLRHDLLEETILLRRLTPSELTVYFWIHSLDQVLDCILPLWQLRAGESGSIEACPDGIVDRLWVEVRSVAYHFWARL
jgi:hypothetical protein